MCFEEGLDIWLRWFVNARHESVTRGLRSRDQNGLVADDGMGMDDFNHNAPSEKINICTGIDIETYN